MRRLSSLPILLLFAACGDPDIAVDLRFEASADGQPASCGESVATLSDLRFFVSEVAFFSKSGQSMPVRAVPAKVTAASPWQTSGVALVDLENGQGACRNGTSLTNNKVQVTLPAGDYDGMQFTVGVPFELNHANPLLAEAPLNDGAMHWHWRSGYKFLRAGVASEAGDTWIHLGSTGCEGTVGDISGCNAPNRVIVRLMDFDPSTDRIAVDVNRLLDAAAMLAAGDKTDCSSGPAEVACKPLFAALGLPFGGDDSETEQRVFSVAR